MKIVKQTAKLIRRARLKPVEALAAKYGAAMMTHRERGRLHARLRRYARHAAELRAVAGRVAAEEVPK